MQTYTLIAYLAYMVFRGIKGWAVCTVAELLLGLQELSCFIWPNHLQTDLSVVDLNIQGLSMLS